jgi:hypothetical protein
LRANVPVLRGLNAPIIAKSIILHGRQPRFFQLLCGFEKCFHLKSLIISSVR